MTMSIYYPSDEAAERETARSRAVRLKMEAREAKKLADKEENIKGANLNMSWSKYDKQ